MTAVAEAEAPSRDLAAAAAALVTVVLWASAFVGIRSAAGEPSAPARFLSGGWS